MTSVLQCLGVLLVGLSLALAVSFSTTRQRRGLMQRYYYSFIYYVEEQISTKYPVVMKCKVSDALAVSFSIAGIDAEVFDATKTSRYSFFLLC